MVHFGSLLSRKVYNNSFEMINIRKMLRSFGYAAEGLGALFRYENNARFHFLAALIVVVLGIWLELDSVAWALIVLAISGVWATEAFNTALEKLCDLVSPDFHPQVKVIKDLAAAGVLIMAVGASIIGILILGKKLMILFINSI
jgi:diacylglycerol kinase